MGRIEQKFENGETILGTITHRVKGGLSVDIGVKAFLPGSQVSLRPMKSLEQLLERQFEFRIIKFNKNAEILYCPVVLCLKRSVVLNVHKLLKTWKSAISCVVKSRTSQNMGYSLTLVVLMVFAHHGYDLGSH